MAPNWLVALAQGPGCDTELLLWIHDSKRSLEERRPLHLHPTLQFFPPFFFFKIHI